MPVYNNTRIDPRVKLRKDLTSYLFNFKTRKPVMCMGTDVSRNGIGIVTFEETIIGEDLLLVLKEIGIKLKVTWCKKDNVRDGIFHSGLNTHDAAHNLIKLFEREGLIEFVEGT